MNLRCPKCNSILEIISIQDSYIYPERKTVFARCPQTFSCGIKEITISGEKIE